MPLEFQPVLLRVLEEKKIMRVGSSKYIPVDFNLIAATNKDLWTLVENKLFREDLYYRLAVFKINIPPLRQRGMDILKLARYFICQTAAQQNIPIPTLSKDNRKFAGSIFLAGKCASNEKFHVLCRQYGWQRNDLSGRFAGRNH
jgi:transcriptional regulator with GAF, ATPase, and Fis domain